MIPGKRLTIAELPLPLPPSSYAAPPVSNSISFDKETPLYDTSYDHDCKASSLRSVTVQSDDGHECQSVVYLSDLYFFSSSQLTSLILDQVADLLDYRWSLALSQFREFLQIGRQNIGFVCREGYFGHPVMPC